MTTAPFPTQRTNTAQTLARHVPVRPKAGLRTRQIVPTRAVATTHRQPIAAAVVHAHDRGMEVEPHFAPPDPSGEVMLPTNPPEWDRPSTKARAAMLVAVGVLAVAGLFFVGRWTTGGERDALASERDAALTERNELETSVAELQHDLEQATATNTTNQSAIEELQADAAQDATELSRLEADVARLTIESAELRHAHDELSGHLEAVAECGNSVEFAKAALDAWDAMLPVLDEYLFADLGSEAGREALERLNRAWAEIDTAESNYIASSSLCTSALEALPDCDVESGSLRLTAEASTTPCPGSA